MQTFTLLRTQIALFILCILFFAPSSSPALTWAFDSYQGNGTAGYPIIGLGFQPDVVIIKGTAATQAYIRTSSMGMNQSKRMDISGAFETDAIQSFTGSGFTLGTNAAVNTNGATYEFAAFQSGTDMKVGTFTGNGGFNQTISLSFQPDVIFIFSGTTGSAPAFTCTAMPANNTAFFGTSMLWSNYITSLNATSFTVGSFFNVNATVYYYVAFKQVSGSEVCASYIGSAGMISPPTVNMTPEYVIACNGAVGGYPVQKMTSNATAESMLFTPVASATTDIVALSPGSFSAAGGSPNANSTTNTNYFIAFGNGIAYPLPINLLSFKAACAENGADLTWVTGSETNNDYFTVERYTNASSAPVIVGRHPGAGNSTSLHTYSMHDDQVISQTVYYRLRQTDFNGHSTVSNPVAVDPCLSIEPYNLKLYPNPALREISCLFESGSETTSCLQIYSAEGTLLLTRQWTTEKGTNIMQLDLGSFPPGIYLLRLSTNERVMERKFIRE